MEVISRGLVEQIYDVIKERIINFDLKLGTRMNLQELTKEFGVSQTPIREALHRLSRDGLVRMVRRGGYYIVKPSFKDMNEIYDLRELLEVYALECTTKNNADVQPLLELKEEIEKAIRCTDAQLKKQQHNITDHKLHLWIIESSGNNKLYGLYAHISNFIKISQRLDRNVDNSLKEHIELIEAILSADVQKAKDILIKHIENGRKKRIKNLKMFYD